MNISLSPEILTFIGSLPVTNTLVITVCLSAVIIFVSLIAQKKISLIPGKMQNAFEVIFEFLLSLVQDVMQDRALAKKTFPLIVTIFLFVWLANLAEMLPGLGTIGLAHAAEGKTEIIPFIRSASADMNVTLALTLISVVATHWYGMRAVGPFSYWRKFFVSPFKRPYGIGTFVGLLELVSEFSKVLSFSFRLFGNIFAGEVLLIVMLTLVPYIVPLPFLALELFVGAVQALVFAMLTAIFIKMATLEAH